jgi:hypothetical protein
LQGNISNQTYEIPLGAVVSEYRSVVIYCKPFNALFGVVALREPGV